jgi:hypothetical protein
MADAGPRPGDPIGATGSRNANVDVDNFNRYLMGIMARDLMGNPKYGGNLQIETPYLQEGWFNNIGAREWLEGYGGEAWNEAYRQRDQFGQIPGQVKPYFDEAWNSSRNITGSAEGVQNRGIGYLDALFPGVQQMSATVARTSSTR